jgi:hypothetical protein
MPDEKEIVIREEDVSHSFMLVAAPIDVVQKWGITLPARAGDRYALEVSGFEALGDGRASVSLKLVRLP